MEITELELPGAIDLMTGEEKLTFVGNESSLRWNNDRTKCATKMKVGFTETPTIDIACDIHTHESILIEMSKPEWIQDDL